MKSVSFWVDDFGFDEIMKKELVEIVTRRNNAQYEHFFKVYKSDIIDENSINALINTNAITGAKIDNVYTTVNNIQALSKGIRNINLVSTALSGLNLVTDIIGFSVIHNDICATNQQLVVLNDHFEELRERIDDLTDILIEEILIKIYREYDEHISQCKRYYDQFAHNEVDLDSLESEIVNIKAYIKEIISRLNNKIAKNRMAELYELVIEMMAIYTLLLFIYNRTFFLTKKRLSPQVNDYISLFDYFEKTKKGLNSKIFDYYFLEEKKSFRDIVRMQDVIDKSCSSYRIKIEDEKKMFDIMQTPENYYRFEKRRLEELPYSDISKIIGKPEDVCRSYFLGEEI